MHSHSLTLTKDMSAQTNRYVFRTHHTHCTMFACVYVYGMVYTRHIEPVSLSLLLQHTKTFTAWMYRALFREHEKLLSLFVVSFFFFKCIRHTHSHTYTYRMHTLSSLSVLLGFVKSFSFIPSVRFCCASCQEVTDLIVNVHSEQHLCDKWLVYKTDFATSTN